MKITINGKEYGIHFGVGFVRELDKVHFVEGKNGVKFGAGLETTLPLLLTGDLVTLSDYLYHGTCTEESRPTRNQVDAYVDDTKDADRLMAEVTEELKKPHATRKAVEMYLKIFEKKDPEKKK